MVQEEEEATLPPKNVWRSGARNRSRPPPFFEWQRQSSHWVAL